MEQRSTCSIGKHQLNWEKGGGGLQVVLVMEGKKGLEAAANACLSRSHQRPGRCDECDGDSGLFCGPQADAAAGWAPDFLLRAPAQSILLCSTHRTTLYLGALQETVTAANRRASFTKTLKISTVATIGGFLFF